MGRAFFGQEDGVVIEGTTPIGRATCLRLDLNDIRYPEEDSSFGCNGSSGLSVQEELRDSLYSQQNL